MNLFKLVKEEYNNMIKEVGNASAKSYDYKVIGTYGDDSIEYEFITDLNTKYEVSITEFYTQYFLKRGNTGITVDFIANDSIKIENKGELYKVMATITNIIKDYIKNKKIDIIHFQTDNKRHKLYAAYLKKYFSKKIEGEGDNIYYFLKRDIIKESDYKGDHKAPDSEYGSPLHDVTNMFGKDFYDLSVSEIARQFGGFNLYDTLLASIIKSYKDKPNKPIKIYRAIPDFNKENKDKIKDLNFILNYYNKFNFFPHGKKNKKYSDIVHDYENTIKNENNDIDYDQLQNEIYNRIIKEIKTLKSNNKKYSINNGDWVTIIKDYAIQHGKNELNNRYVILTKTVKASEIFTEGYLEEWGYDPKNKLNENNNAEDIQSFIDVIDINPDSPEMDRYKKTLKDKYHYDYIYPNVRYKKDIEIVNKLINKRFNIKTNKGFEFYFITSSRPDLLRSVIIEIFNYDNKMIGGVGFNINTTRGTIQIGGAKVLESHRRKGVYSKVVDYIENVAKKYNFKIIEGSRSSDAKSFWRDREEKINNNINESIDQQTDISKYPFVNDIQTNYGKIYFVGGFVRDSFLNKESKDIDILVTGIPMDKLENILSKHGKVDSVGKSFGVLKFIPEGSDIDLDISIPRTEKSTGDKYTDFKVVSDHTLSVEDDLGRRDFTLNAIAKDINGNIIDPFNGLNDLKSGNIKMVNPKAFSEDPLRMLRAIQFSSRFNFNIDKETFNQIKSNSSKIKSITPERILIEFDKIVKKGKPKIGIENLINTDLYEQIFNAKPNISSDINQNKIKTMGEFIFILCFGSSINNISEFYKNKLNGDKETTKEIKALEEIYNKFNKNRLNNLLLLFNVYSIYPNIIECQIFDSNKLKYINEFKKYPKTLKELNINGGDIMNLGFKGPEIKEIFLKIIKGIFNDEIKNNKNEIINYIK